MERDLDRDRTFKRLLNSHLILRRVLGILGIGLPLVLMIWGFFLFDGILPSISDYYSAKDSFGHSYGTRDIFVGTLLSIGFFLGAYKGYERRDDIAGYLACVFALGVAFFPNNPDGWWNYVHFISAACLFLVLSFFSIILFTKTKPSKEVKWWNRIRDVFRKSPAKHNGSRKKVRNTIHVLCGFIMLLCMVLFALAKLYGWLFVEEKTGIFADDSTFLFWIESSMLWAFGISWIAKGEWLGFLKDKKQPELKLRELRLNVKDTEASKKFYNELLGISLITDEEGLLVLDSGWPNLDITPSTHTSDSLIISFIVKDHSRIVNKLSTYDIEIEDPIKVDHKMLATILKDPDGNRVEIQTPTEESPDWLRAMVE